MKNFYITIEVSMNDDCESSDAEIWVATLLDLAKLVAKKQNTLQGNEHPYHPRIIGATEVQKLQ